MLSSTDFFVRPELLENKIGNPNYLLLNVRSLSVDKCNELELILNAYSGNIKFICLTETWATDTSISSFSFSNYSLVSYYCRKSVIGGGVAIWCAKGLNVQAIKLDHFCMDKNFEICGISCKLDSNNTLLLFSCYRSPTGDVSMFCDQLYNVLNLCFKPKLKIICCGDFNIDAKVDSKNLRLLSSVFTSFNLGLHLTNPTRVKNNSASTIDLLYSNLWTFDNNWSGVNDNNISDHRTILYNLPALQYKPVSQKFFKRNINDQEAIVNFLTSLSQMNWNDFYKIGNIDDAFEYFINTFQYYFDIYFPKKLYFENALHKNWVNDDVKNNALKINEINIPK